MSGGGGGGKTGRGGRCPNSARGLPCLFVDSKTNFSNKLKLNCQIPPISLFVSVFVLCLSLEKGRALKMCDVSCCLIKPTIFSF